jgi:hypothetical protein
MSEVQNTNKIYAISGDIYGKLDPYNDVLQTEFSDCRAYTMSSACSAPFFNHLPVHISHNTVTVQILTSG